ncbi:MAG: DUF1957 domain-containing protein [Deltaproteobacteria bacterium]|nr:DUF1957 domain-containing protein [Deltaproteobacteria bacterium]
MDTSPAHRAAAPTGHLLLVLHAHLPWVRHPEYPDFLEERWLFEAITETYLPLLNVLEGVAREDVPCRLALSMSPTLLAMLVDPLLQGRYVRHLDRLITFSDAEVRRLRGEEDLQRVARLYRESLRGARRSFCDRYEGNLLPAFRSLAESGVLELVACPATHAYLPLLVHPTAVRAQIRVGMDEYRRLFGWDPEGLWLPECGFTPDLDEILAECGVRWTILEGHAFGLAQPRPILDLDAPLRTPAGIAAFARDAEMARRVWSEREGYPADPDYRDFHRDVGFDLDLDLVRTIIAPTGERVTTGIKYHRITGAGLAKEPYDPLRARAKASAHASNFVAHCTGRLGRRDASRAPSPVAAYDAELFGHWWFEGPQWLDLLVRKLAYDQSLIALATPSDVLTDSPPEATGLPGASSWGEGGYHRVWLNGANDWIYPPLHDAGDRMCALASSHAEPRGLELRALNQAARELLLAQASDWPFMMSQQTAVDYAVQRVRGHLASFARIADDLESRSLDDTWLAELEARDNLFPALDYRVYRTGQRPR